jgi:hypothetical protein
MPVVISTPFGFGIDVTFWAELFSAPSSDIIESLFAIVGWTVLALIFFFMGKELWVQYRFLAKYLKKWKWVLLAVDIPALYIQTPKAVEQIFAHLSGAKVTPNIGQKFWMGKKQKSFSFEIISLEGYIQFLVRCESEYRDLVEAAIYAQYAEAEITEVEDYVGILPKHFPDDNHDVYGVEFVLAEEDSFPIRTYPSFEYNISKDLVFSDPMAAILENFSRIGKGENLFFQIIIEPTDNSWKEKGIELVKKIVANKKGKSKESFISNVGGLPKALAQEAINIWDWNFEPTEREIKKEDLPGKVMDLTPGGKTTVEAIEEKISKIGFKTKIRALYVARKEVYNPGRCIEGLIGAMNQFHIVSRNALVPHGFTEAYYFFKNNLLNFKKRVFCRSYFWRLPKSGGNSYVMNIEELATVWHFPLPFVKTPLLQKSETKRGEPPMNLPLEVSEAGVRMKKVGVREVEPEINIPSSKELPYA